MQSPVSGSGKMADGSRMQINGTSRGQNEQMRRGSARGFDARSPFGAPLPTLIPVDFIGLLRGEFSVEAFEVSVVEGGGCEESGRAFVSRMDRVFPFSSNVSSDGRKTRLRSTRRRPRLTKRTSQGQS